MEFEHSLAVAFGTCDGTLVGVLHAKDVVIARSISIDTSESKAVVACFDCFGILLLLFGILAVLLGNHPHHLHNA